MDIRSRPRLPQGNSAWPEDVRVCARSVTVVLPRGTKECGAVLGHESTVQGRASGRPRGAYTDDQGIQLPGDSAPLRQGRWGMGDYRARSTEQLLTVRAVPPTRTVWKCSVLPALCSLLVTSLTPMKRLASRE